MLARRHPLQPKSLLKQRKPLRRGKGRVRATAAELKHIARVAAMPCLLQGDRVAGWLCQGPRATVHHVTASIHGGRIARSHKRIVPLCAAHHLIQYGPRDSVEALGHGGFYEAYGIDLLAEADRLWREYGSA